MTFFPIEQTFQFTYREFSANLFIKNGFSFQPDAIEEFYDTHSPSLPRRGSSKSSSTNSKKAPTIAQPAKYSSKETGYVDDLDAFEMEDEDDM